MKQAGHGSLGSVQLTSDLGESPSLEMMQLDHPALVLGSEANAAAIRTICSWRMTF